MATSPDVGKVIQAREQAKQSMRPPPDLCRVTRTLLPQMGQRIGIMPTPGCGPRSMAGSAVHGVATL